MRLAVLAGQHLAAPLFAPGIHCAARHRVRRIEEPVKRGPLLQHGGQDNDGRGAMFQSHAFDATEMEFYRVGVLRQRHVAGQAEMKRGTRRKVGMGPAFARIEQAAQGNRFAGVGIPDLHDVFSR